jgi:hypothetical protein
MQAWQRWRKRLTNASIRLATLTAVVAWQSAHAQEYDPALERARAMF